MDDYINGEAVFMEVAGKVFHCSCGSNLFIKNRNIDGLHLCNNCKTEYANENYSPSRDAYLRQLILSMDNMLKQLKELDCY